MKIRIASIAALALAVSALSAGAAFAHGQAEARHGGLVAMSQDLSFELVSQPGGVALYVEDHGKPVAASSLSGKLTVLSGGKTADAVLTPAGDKLEAKGVTLSPGSKVVASVTTAAKKTVTVRFSVK